MTNQNRPVYRHPPRSHAYSCRCPRCEPFRNRSLGSSGARIWPLLAALGAISWAAGAAAHHLLQTAVAGAGIVVLALVSRVVVIVNRRAGRPPKGRLRVEATTVSQLKPPPASVCVPRPICLHWNAVKVDSSVVPDLIWQCWCPDCEEPLPADFRLPCCGTEPGDGTGPAVHVYNCRRAVKR